MDEIFSATLMDIIKSNGNYDYIEGHDWTLFFNYVCDKFIDKSIKCPQDNLGVLRIFINDTYEYCGFGSVDDDPSIILLKNIEEATLVKMKENIEIYKINS